MSQSGLLARLLFSPRTGNIRTLSPASQSGAVHCSFHAWRAPRCYMTFPTKPNQAYDYVTYQIGSPTTPLPANQVAGDFANHKATIDAVIEFQKLVQRSDGRFNNGSVRPETLSAGTVALIGKWTPRGNWLTATAYAVNDLGTESNNLYVCIVAHTSRTFATDLAAGKWQLIDGDTARAGANNTFTGANTFSGAVDVTVGTLAVPTAAVGDSDSSAASTAFVQAATGKVYVQTFSATGTYTPHAGMVNCIIECWGAGGGGGTSRQGPGGHVAPRQRTASPRRRFREEHPDGPDPDKAALCVTVIRFSDPSGAAER